MENCNRCGYPFAQHSCPICEGKTTNFNWWNFISDFFGLKIPIGNF